MAILLGHGHSLDRLVSPDPWASQIHRVSSEKPAAWIRQSTLQWQQLLLASDWYSSFSSIVLDCIMYNTGIGSAKSGNAMPIGWKKNVGTYYINYVCNKAELAFSPKATEEIK